MEQIIEDALVGEHVLVASGSDREGGGCLFAIYGDHVEKIDTLHSTGLAVAQGSLYRVLWSIADVKAAAVGELLVYDGQGVLGYHRIDGLDDPHGVLWDGEHFIIPCSSSNEIVWLDRNGSIQRIWRAPGENDSWHVNGVYIHDGRLFASAFGRFEQREGWKHDMDAPCGMIFDVENLKDAITGLTCPHAPTYLDGGWLVCNSRRHEVVHFDRSGSRMREAQLGGWTRGIVVDGDHIYVGISGERHVKTDFRQASVVTLDRRTLERRAELPLPCFEITALCLAPREILRGLRRGFRTNPRRVSAEDREDVFRIAGSVHPIGQWTPMNPVAPGDCRCVMTVKAPAEVVAGNSIPVDIEVTNRGPVTLFSAPPHPVHLGYRWWGLEAWVGEPEVDYLRFPLTAPLAPGEKMKWQLGIPAPFTPGLYDLALSLVQEWVAWFDELNAANGCRIRVNVARTASARAD